MSDPVRRVGVVGLGRMGSAIAHRILQAGYEVTVYNRTVEKARPLAAAGARVASTAREADVVVTSLTDDDAVRDVTEGAAGILAGLAPGAIHLGISTISPGRATTLGALHANHGSHYVAAPVLGRPEAAAAGMLLTFVAGISARGSGVGPSSTPIASA